MTEQMLYEILVFVAGMTTVLTASRLMATYLKRTPAPTQEPGALNQRVECLELVSEATIADVERVANVQTFMSELMTEKSAAVPR